jgi:hypothetical protein
MFSLKWVLSFLFFSLLNYGMKIICLYYEKDYQRMCWVHRYGTFGGSYINRRSLSVVSYRRIWRPPECWYQSNWYQSAVIILAEQQDRFVGSKLNDWFVEAIVGIVCEIGDWKFYASGYGDYSRKVALSRGLDGGYSW